MACADHQAAYTREGIRELYIEKNLAFRLERNTHLHHGLLIALRHRKAQLEAEDLRLLNVAQAADYAYFTTLVAFTHPKFSSEWAPELWRAAILKGWQWRARIEPLADPSQVSYKMFAALIRTPEDLQAAFDILSTARAPLDPVFAATRPPYMSREGDLLDYTIGDLTYGPIFEEILERNGSDNDITMMLPQEVDVFFLRYVHLPNLISRFGVLRARWAYEREKVWAARRRTFKQIHREAIIAEALHPRRIERFINEHGIDALAELY